MTWTAVTPMKPPGQRKSRLAGRLSVAERDALADCLALHVAQCLAAEPRISQILLLSAARNDAWPHQWRHDQGRGLNAELDALRAVTRSGFLVIHSDLPLLAPDDVAAMLDAAGSDRVAIAPDRRGRGTNAVALGPEIAFGFAFGDGSFARHRQNAGGVARIVERSGLALDLDVPEDLDMAIAQSGRDR